MQARIILGGIVAAAVMASATGTLAWGDQGHELVAMVAYRLLAPAVKSQVDAMLAADTDTSLTQADFASRATWADKFRDMDNRTKHYNQTQQWHFVDQELSNSDLKTACFGYPPLPAGMLASNGQASDCVVDKIVEFEAELANSATSADERLMALKFLMHFVGDVHQPLHASDDNDHGGNCEQVRTKSRGRKEALHHFWDADAVVDAIALDQKQHPEDDSVDKVADRYASEVASQASQPWKPSDVSQWARDSFSLGKTIAYKLPAHPGCADKAADYPAFTLSSDYQAQAAQTAHTQIALAGARLASVLNTALASRPQR